MKRDYYLDEEPRYRKLRKPKKTKISKWANIRNPDNKSKAKDLVFNGTLVRVWHPEIEKDKDTQNSIKQLTRYPDIFPYISIMPDYHIGENSVNGSIIPSRNLLYINAIGGDIGCGISSLSLPITLDRAAPFLQQIYESIYSSVPSGRRLNLKFSEKLHEMPVFNSQLEVMNKSNKREAMQQLGSLGSGNHFIEVQVDEDNQLNLMVHTGSRNLGQVIRKIFIRKGKKLDSIPGMFYLEADSPEGKSYLEHIQLALDYSKQNRQEIMGRVYRTFVDNIQELQETRFKSVLESVLDISHNQITRETHFGEQVYVHRKGAIHLPKGQLGMIPGSMGTASYIVEGKGNQYSFESCSHGAGRRMSRGKALNTIRMKDYLNSVEGILCRRDDSIRDEAPQAYKSIEQILKYQKDLVAIRKKLTPIACIKG